MPIWSQAPWMPASTSVNERAGSSTTSPAAPGFTVAVVEVGFLHTRDRGGAASASDAAHPSGAGEDPGAS